MVKQASERSKPRVASDSKAEELARQLAGAVGRQTVILGTLAREQDEISNLEALLAAELLKQEPHAVENGRAPVVAFERRWSGKRYSYAAVGISGLVNEYPTDLTWYLTSVLGPTERMTWSELIRFMGVDGLSTLEILRGE